ncbi:MAG: winged helix-turn-helix transcriptional regulator [Methanobacteriaceae archaeon]|nr:winged helix-turn-helix transcriptional regulator [Methanobacteriaceae archaeon]
MKSCEVSPDGKPDQEQIERLKKIISKIPDDNTLYKNSDILKALGDPTRLKIIYLLTHGELCVCEIIKAMDKPQPTVSHHLNILKKAGFLKWRKEGVWVHYSLSNPKITDTLDELLKK